ncbi:hydroxypyruvate isomerase [Alloalcanivorax xenomutans]|uniref:Hydroxypyruvate isomerase n=1 Tax=Alloalcanivorax xenomutans TaxID=1094342 RepID=A0A9Q3W630_9GAMM|nr:hydroxypyruvate isomerase [Alloalcanivorax xenomutans]MCE7508497.1 hydroxypyruvate isomerase [Alloalcanivorax xenomutans]
MPRFAANLTLLFTELPFLERYAAAAEAGFKGVECLFPYEWAPTVLAECLREHDLRQVLFNLPAGDWGAGDRGLAALPDREAEFRDGVARALAYTEALDCPRVNCLAGIPAAGADPEHCFETLVHNLRYAADRLVEQGREVTVEPINTRVDIPGFFLATSDQALAAITAADRPNLRLQYDLYHAWVMGEAVAASLSRLRPHIGHVQFADAPGRHQPGSGEMPLAELFARLDQIGYQGWVSAEYRPLGHTRDSLGWLPV